MTLLALHLLLALAWAMASGSVTLASLLLGFLIGGGVLHLLGPALGSPRYAIRAYRAVVLAGVFLWELVASSVRVAVDIVRPRLTMTPAVVAVPLDVRDPLQVTLLANLVSLTPGTLSIDVSGDNATLYVHAMYGEDPDAIRQHIKHAFERRILEVFA